MNFFCHLLILGPWFWASFGQFNNWVDDGMLSYDCYLKCVRWRLDGIGYFSYCDSQFGHMFPNCGYPIRPHLTRGNVILLIYCLVKSLLSPIIRNYSQDIRYFKQIITILLYVILTGIYSRTNWQSYTDIPADVDELLIFLCKLYNLLFWLTWSRAWF